MASMGSANGFVGCGVDHNYGNHKNNKEIFI